MRDLTNYSMPNNSIPIAARVFFTGLFAVSTLALAQDQPPAPPTDSQPTVSSGGWKRVGAPDQNGPYAPAAPNDSNQVSSWPAPPPQNYPAGAYQNGGNPAGPYPQGGYPQAGYQQGPPPPQQGSGQPYQNQPYQNQQQYQYAAPPPVPASLSIPAGTYLTVRVNQFLTSDRNQAGDAFSASLVQPLVVNGVVLAEPGQTIGGRVVESSKGGRVEGVARLGIQLTDLSLVDGQQLPLHSTLISRSAPTSNGRDTGAIIGTTGLGAAIGAAANGGTGAAVGAGAGLVASVFGVLVTRGHPSVIYPEQVLTFRLDSPISVTTQNSPQAFRYVQPGEYDRPSSQPSFNYSSPAPYAAAPAPYAYGYPYPYSYSYGYPYWGSSFSFYYGPRFGYGYRGGGYWGGGYRGGFGGRGRR